MTSRGNSAAGDRDAGSATPGRPRFSLDRVTAVVVAVALLALALRFVDLGARVAHWQEARLGWWIDHYARTGSYAQRPALGGGLGRILGRLSVGVLGATDAAIRAPVAVVGGLLPLSALALRRRLDDAEVVLLAGLLAATPLLVYYPRFASVDALAAALALVAVAAVVAVREVPRRGRLVASVVAAVLVVGADPAAAAGHLAALLVAWGVALLLLPPSNGPRAAAGSDGHLGGEAADRPADAGTDGGRSATAPVPAPLRHAWRESRGFTVAVAVVLLLVLLDPDLPFDAVGALTDPARLPLELLDPLLALVGQAERVLGGLVARPGPVAGTVGLLWTVPVAAPVVTGLAVVGVLAERWSGRPVRPLVAVAATWGLLAVPLLVLFGGAGTPLTAVHVIVPLAVPAAVGGVVLGRWTRDALAGGDGLTGGPGLLAAVLAVAVVVAALGSGVYLSPTSPGAGPVQYGQPSQDLRGPVDALLADATTDGRPDLVVYGTHFVESAHGGLEPRCARWYNALPLPWYAAAADADVACAASVTRLRQHLAHDPTVVVGRRGPMATVDGTLDGYDGLTTRFRAWNANVTVLVRDGAG
jgi:predicted membrane-bound mannosyltransferase